MAGCCATCLFFSYISGTIVYLVLAIFATTGNITLLVEHYKYETGNNTEKIVTDIERVNVKSRTFSQYYMVCGISLVLSIILYIFLIREKKEKKVIINETKSQDFEYKPDLIYQPENEINTNNNLPIELAQGDKEIIRSINTTDSLGFGMGENEI